MLTHSIKQAALVVSLMAASFSAGIALQPVLAQGNNNISVFLQVYDYVSKDYVQKDLEHDKLIRGAIEGMLESLDDPYTRYLSVEEFTEMQEEQAGEFSGIGIQIGLRENLLTVIAPIEDTPAWEAGLKPGDMIQGIDGKSTEKMTLDDAVKLIRGKEGTAVKLSVYRPETKKSWDVDIKRATIHNKVVKYKMQDNKIGYLRLTSFMQSDAPQEVEKALKDLKKQGMKGLILDIRLNPGGLLQNAVSIGSLFVNEGPIVRIVDRQDQEERLNASSDKVVLDKQVPMVVLIDRGSASASEILAGTLKDNKRATLMGTRTFGKGLVQSVYNLSDGSGLAVTTQKYLTTGGTDINKKGIEPDVEVVIPKENLEKPYSEANDIQLQKALQFLNTRTATK